MFSVATDGPTLKWLIPNKRWMRPPSWLEIASESSAEAPSAGVLSGRRARRALFASLSQRQQFDDVARRQGRIGAVRQREPAGRPREIERHFVLANGGGGFDVQHRIEAERVGEINVAARNRVLVAAETHFSAQQMNVAEKNRMLPGAAQAQVGVGQQPRAGPFHARIRAGLGLNIELQILQEGRIGARPGRRLLGRNHEAAEIETFRHQQAVDHDAPGKRRRIARCPASRRFPPTSQLIPIG